MESNKVRDKKTFYRRIAENPGDDGLRLMFADWLEDTGQGPRTEAELARGEFIREQCRFMGAGQTPERALELYKQYGREWFGDDVTYGDVSVFFTYANYERGFPAWRSAGESMLFDEAHRLAVQPGGWGVTALDLRDNDLWNHPECIEAMGRWKNIPHLTALNLGGNGLWYNQAAGIKAMGEWENMPHLIALDLAYNNLWCDQAAGIKAIGQWENMPHLTALDLACNNLCRDQAAGIRAMGEWRNMQKLRRLDLQANGLEREEQVRPLCDAIREGRFPALECVQVDNNYFAKEKSPVQAALDAAIAEWRREPSPEVNGDARGNAGMEREL